MGPLLDISSPPDNEIIRALLSAPAFARIVPYYYKLVQKTNANVAPELKTELRNMYLAALRDAIVLDKELNILLRQFEDAGIAAIPLKGTALSNRLYSDLGMRPSKDIDLLVPEYQIQKALDLLEKNGYEDIHGRELGQHHILHQTARHEARTRIELHRSLIIILPREISFPYSKEISRQLTAAFWKRAYRTGGSSSTHWQMRREDELLYLYLHLLKHMLGDRWLKRSDKNINPHSLLLALDIELALRNWADSLDWALFQNTISDFCLQQQVAVVHSFVNRWYGNTADIPISAELSRYQCHYFLGGEVLFTGIERVMQRLPFGIRVMLDHLMLYDSWSERKKTMIQSCRFLLNQYGRKIWKSTS